MTKLTIHTIGAYCGPHTCPHCGTHFVSEIGCDGKCPGCYRLFWGDEIGPNEFVIHWNEPEWFTEMNLHHNPTARTEITEEEDE